MEISGATGQQIIIPGTFKVESLPTASAEFLGKYAQVSDLFGEKHDVVLCSHVAGTYFWQPVRPFYSRKIALTEDVTLSPLKSPSVVIGTGTLSSNRNIFLDDTMSYPGCSFDVGFAGTTSIGSLSVRAPGGALINTLLAGGTRRYFYTEGAWQAF